MKCKFIYLDELLFGKIATETGRKYIAMHGLSVDVIVVVVQAAATGGGRQRYGNVSSFLSRYFNPWPYDKPVASILRHSSLHWNHDRLIVFTCLISRIMYLRPVRDDRSLCSVPPRSSFRQGLVSGEKYIVYPILEWCLLKLPDLKKRAYLARYLVKIDVPGDILTDPELDVMYKQASCPAYSLFCLITLFSI